MEPSGGTQNVQLKIDNLTFDLERGALCRGSERVLLPPKPFDVLVLLVRNRGRVLSKRELLTTVWGQEYGDQNTVEQAVRQIRVALGDDKDSPPFIQTFPRRGYCFVGVQEPGKEVLEK